MAQQTIDQTAQEQLAVSFAKINQNFNELYTGSGGDANPSYTTVTASGAVTGGSLVISGASALTGLLTEGFASAVTAGSTQTQAGATALTKQVNNITTNATGGNGVALPTSAAGLVVAVINNTANALQVYGNNTEAATINGIATGTGVSQIARSVVFYACGVAGTWISSADGASLPANILASSLTSLGTIASLGFTNGSFTGLLNESESATVTAGATQTQAGATALTTEINVVTTNATAGNGVALPAAALGLDIVIVNTTTKSLQVYGNNASADTINGAATGTGITMPPLSVMLFVCTAAGPSGTWVAEGTGTGYSGQMQTILATDALSANSGGVQAGATAITTNLARFTTVGGSGYSAVLPASAPGLEITVINAGANPMTVWPNGASDTINGNNNASAIPYVLGVNGVVTFACTVAGAWHSLAGAAFPPSIAAGLTSATNVANQQTPTTGGVTLKNQTLVAGSTWRVKAYGTYVAANSGTARNAEFSCFWGSTQLTKVTSVVLASTAQTTGWDVEFTLTASSTTALWATGRLIEQSDVTLTTTAADLDYIILTAASNTSLSSGPQTLDFRVDTSASVAGDAFNVHSVIMERLV